MERKKPLKGVYYYRSLGFEKVVMVPMSKDLHKALKLLADQEERSIQSTARRILEQKLLK